MIAPMRGRDGGIGLDPGAFLVPGAVLVALLLAPTPTAAQADGSVDVATKSGIVAADLEPLIAERVNAERARAGLPLLTTDERLAEIARRHSADMAERKYFDHVSPDGKGPGERGNEVGYRCRKSHGSYITYGLGENIFQSAVFASVTFGSAGSRIYQWMSAEAIAQQVVDGWMGSEGHRENLLKRTFDRQGIGVVITRGGKVLVTQNLC